MEQEIQNIAGFSGARPTETDAMVSNKVDIFTPEKIESGVVRTFSVVQATGSDTASSDGPYRITFPVIGANEAMDPSSMRLHLRLKLQKKVGEKWEGCSNQDGVSVVNNISSALWSRVNVSINDISITQTVTPAYMYQAWLEKLLNYGSDAEATVLENCLYHRDGHGIQQEFFKPTGAAEYQMKSGLEERAAKLEGGKELDVNDILHTEISSLSRYLPPGCKVQLDFTRNKDDFVLITAPDKTDTEFRIVITNMYVTVNYVQLSPSVLAEYDRRFAANELASYPLTRVIQKTIHVQNGLLSLKTENLFQNTLPYAIVVGIVDGNAYTNSRVKNPFYFKHCNLENVELVYNSESLPKAGLVSDFGAADCRTFYRHFIDSVGVGAGANVPNITYKDFCSGYTLAAWDLSADTCLGYHNHLARTGTINIKYTLKENLNLDGGCTMIVWALYNDSFHLSKVNDKLNVLVRQINY